MILEPSKRRLDDEVIVFDNLVRQGFHMVESSDLTIDFDHLAVALMTLGIFHASSFALENKIGAKVIDLYPKLVEENCYPKHRPNSMRFNGFLNAIKTGIAPMIEVISKFKNFSILSQIVETFQDKMIEIADLVLPSDTYQNFFGQADLQCNNLMFQCNENRKPIACKFVYFQFSRYALPDSWSH